MEWHRSKNDRNPSMVRLVLAFSLISVPAFAQTLYQTQDAAQHACPTDTVVWLNTNSDIYHFQGERWYDNTEEGAFVCEKDADANGDRPTENGQ
jgi:hypothetical protein